MGTHKARGHPVRPDPMGAALSTWPGHIVWQAICLRIRQSAQPCDSLINGEQASSGRHCDQEAWSNIDLGADIKFCHPSAGSRTAGGFLQIFLMMLLLPRCQHYCLEPFSFRTCFLSRPFDWYLELSWAHWLIWGDGFTLCTKLSIVQVAPTASLLSSSAGRGPSSSTREFRLCLSPMVSMFQWSFAPRF